MGKKEIYEFGNFRLDVDEHTIERVDGDVLGTLPDKTFLALVFLLRQRGHLITKDELLQHVWPDTVVEENNLEQRIHYLRQFLGKSESGEKLIETVRGHGYRFVGRVNVVEVSGTWLPETLRLPDEDKHRETGNGDHAETNGSLLTVERATDNKKPGASFRSSRKVVIACCAAGAVVIAVVVGYFGFVRTGSAGTPRSIVVLPVAPINAERDDLYDIGIAESLINRVSSSEGLTVRPLSSVRDYAGQKIDPIAVGNEQKVDYVLASNYQIANGRIKITGQLYNVASGKVEDTFRSEQDVANVFAAQDAIAAEFGNQLITRFGAKPGGPLAKRGTVNAEAYRLYQQAMYLMNKHGRGDAQKALDSLEQAVTLDPGFARAWAAKATAIWPVGIFSEKGEVYRKSMEATNKALALDPNLSEAHSALCDNKLFYEYDFAGAESACKHAVQLDPNSSRAHLAYGWFLRTRPGRHEEALAELRAAIELEPISYINKLRYAESLYLARRYDEAAVEFQRLIELEPINNVGPYNFLITTLEAQGKETEAFEWFIRLLKARYKDDQAIVPRYQGVYQTSGWRGVLIERATDPHSGLGNSNGFYIACLYARAGEKDKAFEHLERSFQEHVGSMSLLQIQPELDSIRDDPRYADLVKRLERK